VNATEQIPVYTAAAPRVPSSAELRDRIPGWGVDLDRADRPSYPREKRLETGAHWELPESQPETTPRERSIEHQMLPPVYGTSVPLKGLSGRIRRYSYERYSEARAAHWLLLLAADRVDAVESHLASLGTARPDNPITDTGLAVEAQSGGSRFRNNRVDLSHQWLDPIIVAGPWLTAIGAVVGATVVLRRRHQPRITEEHDQG